MAKQREVGEKFWYEPDGVWLEAVEKDGICRDGKILDCYFNKDNKCSTGDVMYCSWATREDSLSILFKQTHLTTADIKKLKLQIHVPDDPCKERFLKMAEEQGIVWFNGEKATDFKPSSDYLQLNRFCAGTLTQGGFIHGYGNKTISVHEYKERYYDTWQKVPEMEKIAVHTPDKDCFNRQMEMYEEMGIGWNFFKATKFTYNRYIVYVSKDGHGNGRITYSDNAEQYKGFKILSVEEYRQQIYIPWKEKQEKKMKNYIVFKTSGKGITYGTGNGLTGAFTHLSGSWEKDNLKPNTTYVLWMRGKNKGLFLALPEGEWDILSVGDNMPNGSMYYHTQSEEFKLVGCNGKISNVDAFIITPKTSDKKKALQDKADKMQEDLEQLQAEIKGME